MRGLGTFVFTLTKLLFSTPSIWIHHPQAKVVVVGGRWGTNAQTHPAALESDILSLSNACGVAEDINQLLIFSSSGINRLSPDLITYIAASSSSDICASSVTPLFLSNHFPTSIATASSDCICLNHEYALFCVKTKPANIP
jgi:hypothetical protein